MHTDDLAADVQMSMSMTSAPSPPLGKWMVRKNSFTFAICSGLGRGWNLSFRPPSLVVLEAPMQVILTLFLARKEERSWLSLEWSPLKILSDGSDPFL